jgi:hypothetical protein
MIICNDVCDIPENHVAFYTAPIMSGGVLIAMPYEHIDGLARQMNRPVRLDG